MTKKQRIAERVKSLLKAKNATDKNPQKVMVYMYRGTNNIGKCESVWMRDGNIMCKVWYWGVHGEGLAYDMLTFSDMKVLEEYLKNGFAIQ